VGMMKFCSASSALMDSPAVSFSFLLKPLEFLHVYSRFVWLFEFLKKCLGVFYILQNKSFVWLFEFLKKCLGVFYILQNKRTNGSSSLKKIQNQRTGTPSYFKNRTRSYGFHERMAVLCPVI